MALSILELLILVTLIVLSINIVMLAYRRGINEEKPIRETKWVWIPPLVVPLIFTTELAYLRHYEISIVAAAVALAVPVVARAMGKASDRQVLFALLSVNLSMVVALYAVYAPSFGNDTYRDAIEALNVLKYEGYKPVYVGTPFLSMGYLYAVASSVTALNPLVTSSIVGAAYLALLPIAMGMLARRLHEDWWVAAALVSITPIAVVWGAWFIPQAYALLMTLLTLYLILSRRWALLPLMVVAILAHLGVALWFLLLLLFLALSNPRRYFPFLAILATSLVVGISVSNVARSTIESAVSSVWGLISNALASAHGGIQRAQFPTNLGNFVSFIPVVAIAIFAFNAFLHGLSRKRGGLPIVLAVIYSALMILVALIGVMYKPGLVLDRYLGLPSIVLLAVLAPIGYSLLTRRSRHALYFATSLLLAAIVAFALSGAFAPYSPLALQPNVYSIGGVLTYGEKENLLNIMKFNFKILTDWRSGLNAIYYLYYMEPLNSIEPIWCGVKHNGVQIVLLGCYNTILNNMTINIFLKQWSYWLVYRYSSSVMPEAYGPGFNITEYLQKSNIAYHSNYFIILRLN